MTLSDFVALPEHTDDGYRFELSEGQLIRLPLDGFLHGPSFPTSRT
jgi:hypothetical protein